MKHLTDEQLSALLDGALPVAELAACEAHVAGCDACRARLAEAGALDATLEKSLTHDPGEAYFESFADRVSARIAEQGSGSAAAPTRPVRSGGRSFWGWLVSPRGLALAGSTAALVLVAGLAWVRFSERGGSASALRAQPGSPLDSRLREESGARPPSDQKTEPQADALLPAPALEAPAAPTEDGSTPVPRHGARVQEHARMREVRPNESGEDVPVRQSAPAAGTLTRDEATTSKLGMMKQRSAAPATGGALTQGAPAPALAPPPATAKRSPAPAANEAPVNRSLAPSPAEGVASFGKEQDTGAAAQSLSPCGSVRDSRGRAVSGAQVMVVNDITRTSRTGPDGSFCLKRLERGDVVSVLRVGYDPVRITVGDDSPLAVVMEPVGTLGPEASKGLVPQGAPSALPQELTSGTTKPAPSTTTKATPTAPVPDPYATQPANVRAAVATAREAARVARRDRSADAMDAAAVRWDAVTALVTGAVLHDARFQALSLRREALSLTPTSERLTRFDADLTKFLAQAPHNLPEYATALRWKTAVEPKNKALYR